VLSRYSHPRPKENNEATDRGAGLLALMPISAQLADAVQAAQASGPFRIAKIRYQQGATLNSEFVVIKNVTHRRHNLRVI